ncbi:MAG TPA: IS30 family transposase [Desulfobacterales bacterium]|nr:IS30 family transposase [Desulfobacterales bacterium]
MSYKHLSLAERHYIQIERKLGKSCKQIACDLGRSASTISREISRNTGLRGYRHQQADRLARQRHQNKPKSLKLTPEIRFIIDTCLHAYWSPEQIAGRLKTMKIISLHHETIYQYILTDKRQGGELYTYLRHQNKTYRKRYGSAHNRTGIPNRKDIDQRPAQANDRSRVGDWEADTIIGNQHQGAIVTLDERKTKLRVAAPLPRKKASDVCQAINSLLEPIKKYVKTITFDNGKEFTQHEKIATTIGCDTFFAKPYHSWERGQNENANGLLRQFFPKKMKLNDVSYEQVMSAVDNLNNRPRKSLNYKTPYEVFNALTGINVRNILSCALIT